VRADLLVNRAFQPFCFFRNRSSEGRSKPPGKPRGYPSTQSSDSIEARNLTDPTTRSKTLFQTLAPNKTPKTKSPKPAGPARLRARRRYTSALCGWQAAFHKKLKKLNEPESSAPYFRRPSRTRASGELKRNRPQDEIFIPDTHLSDCFWRSNPAATPPQGSFFHNSCIRGCAATFGEA